MAIDRSRLPALGPDPEYRFPEVVRHTLPTGLRLWTVEHRDVPVLSFQLLLSGGASADPAERAGLAAFTADMMDEGSGDRTALDIEDALSRIGAQFETEVGTDATILSLLTLSRFCDEALDLLADIVTRPRFDASDFDRIRELRLNRLRQIRDVPPAVADRALARLLYDAHPYGHLPLGTITALRETTLADIARHHAQAWRPSRLTLLAVGDATHEEMRQAVLRVFGGWCPCASEADAAGVRDPTTAAIPAAPLARLALVDRPGAAQSEIRVGQVGVPRSTSDYHPLLMLNTVLGGQFVSRLNMNLREEKGYTYGARSNFEFRRARGPFIVHAAVQTGVTADAVREVLRELTDIAGPRPTTPTEMDLARSALTRGFPRSFETAGQIGRGLAQLALFDLPDDTFERFVPSIHAVSADEVTRAAADRLETSRMAVVIVGDRAVVEPSLTSLGLGEPVVMTPEE